MTDAQEPEQGTEDALELGAEQVYVIFSAPIQEGPAEALITTLTECANSGAQEVRLLLSTGGGSPSVGIALYNLLRGFPFHLVTHNTGNVDSIGVAVYLAGAERLTCGISRFVLHGVTFTAYEGQTFDARAFGEQRDSIAGESERTNAVFRERTNLTEAQITEYAETEHTLNAEEALAAGIAARIEDVDIPDDAVVISVPIPR